MKEKRQVAFIALIKSVNIKSLVSGDKGAQITFEIDSPADGILNKINSLHKADKMVAVGVAEYNE